MWRPILPGLNLNGQSGPVEGAVVHTREGFMSDPDTSVDPFRTTLGQIKHKDAGRYHRSWSLSLSLHRRMTHRCWCQAGHSQGQYLVRDWDREARS